MTTSGLVVTFDPQATNRAATIERIRTAGVFTLSEVIGQALPVALEAPTAHDAEQWCDWLRRLPGVLKVDVASVEYGEPEEETDDIP